jgi:hypothetical protein
MPGLKQTGRQAEKEEWEAREDAFLKKVMIDVDIA